jgi:hypothetical protein
MPLDIANALIGLAGIGLGAAGTYFATKKNNETNLIIAREKLASENKLQTEVTSALRELLLMPEHELRSFEAIKKHVPGFDDNELKRLLVAAGAIAFNQKGTGKELWGLRGRNAGKLAPRPARALRAEISDASRGP